MGRKKKDKGKGRGEGRKGEEGRYTYWRVRILFPGLSYGYIDKTHHQSRHVCSQIRKGWVIRGIARHTVLRRVWKAGLQLCMWAGTESIRGQLRLSTELVSQV